MGKDRFAAHTRRFSDVPRQPCLYAAELTTDSMTLLKVGVSGNAQGRLIALQAEAMRDHGATLGRFVVIPRRTAKAAYEAETRLVRRLAKIASPIDGRREFFAGLTLDDAQACIDEALADPIWPELAAPADPAWSGPDRRKEARA